MGARKVQKSADTMATAPEAFESRDRAGVRPAIFEATGKIIVRRWEIADRYGLRQFSATMRFLCAIRSLLAGCGPRRRLAL